MRSCRDDRGAVAVIVVMLVIVFVGMGAFVVDMGYWYDVRRQLQAAADAGALAGCQQLIIEGAATPAVWEQAETYANANDGKPGDGLAVVPPATGGLSEVTDEYVQVTVTKDATAFFAFIFGRSEKTVSATARARVAYVTGVKNIVPLSVPILQATRVTARVGGAETELDYDATEKTWGGYVDIPSGASLTGHRLDLIAYNGQVSDDFPEGVPQELLDAGRLVRGPSDAPFTDVELDQSTFVSGSGSATFRVRLDAPPAKNPVAELDGTKRTMGLVSGTTSTFACTLPAPDIGDDLYRCFDVDVEVEMPSTWVPSGSTPTSPTAGGGGGGTQKFALQSAASIVARRSTYAFKDIDVSPTFGLEGTGGSAYVEVELNDFEYGEEYLLKVQGGSGEAGNFLALDMNSLRHLAIDGPLEYDFGGGNGASAYSGYLELGFPGTIHIGDVVWTQTGVMGGPTRSGLNDRLAGDAGLSFEAWIDAEQPGTKRLVYVPVVEQLGKNASNPLAGTTPMKIVALAAFYIDPESQSAGSEYVIVGRFVRYVTPAEGISDDPPSAQYYIEIPHLVTPVIPGS